MADDNAVTLQRAQRRIARRLLPFVCLLYVVAYIDRVNVGYAALAMTQELGFDAAVYGFGAGIFFLGYFLLEIPSTLLVERWSARRWIARILVTWGVLAAGMGLVRGAQEFYVLRFALGAAEAGFFPGIVVYLSHWFPRSERARAIALFMTAVPLSQVLGAPLSGLLLDVHWFGVAGWRWLFVLEALPAIVLGVVTLFHLTDWPHQARWLTPAERAAVAHVLAGEQAAATHLTDMRAGLRNPTVWSLALALFCILSCSYSFAFWQPKILQAMSGLPNAQVAWLCAVPYAAGAVAMLCGGISSDRRRERRWHVLLPLLCTACGYLLAATVATHLAIALPVFCLIVCGHMALLPAFWTLPSTVLRGPAAALATAIVCSIGNLGGFLGPYMVGHLNAATHAFGAAFAFLAACALIGAALIYRITRVTSAADVAHTPIAAMPAILTGDEHERPA